VQRRGIQSRLKVRTALAAAAALLFAAAVPSAHAAVRCTSGSTIFLDGNVRIFSIPFKDDDEVRPFHYACLGGRGRPLLVGTDGEGPGVALGYMPAYAFAGGRYLMAVGPGAAQPTVLEPAGATALAASRESVYWTAGGAPHRWVVTATPR
jgi:hypothetical protein